MRAEIPVRRHRQDQHRDRKKTDGRVQLARAERMGEAAHFILEAQGAGDRDSPRSGEQQFPAPRRHAEKKGYEERDLRRAAAAVFGFAFAGVSEDRQGADSNKAGGGEYRALIDQPAQRAGQADERESARAGEGVALAFERVRPFALETDEEAGGERDARGKERRDDAAKVLRRHPARPNR